MADTYGHDEAMRDALATLDNSAMLCTSRDKAIAEAFATNPVCQTCGREKAPHGRSLPDGYVGAKCTDTYCEGYNEAPYPLNLFAAERTDIRRLVNEALTRLEAADTRLLAAAEAVVASPMPLQYEQGAFDAWVSAVSKLRAAIEQRKEGRS